MVRRSAAAFLRDAAAQYDLVLLDPPYRLAPRLGPELSAPVAAVLAPDGLAVSECDRRDPLDLPDLPIQDERRYGDTLIRLHAHSEHRIAVCPGTYDPVTLGHLDVITRASKLFDEIIVAVVNASVRKSKALFTTEERIGFIEEATKDIENVRVEPFDVLVVEFARRNEAVAIVKGLRAISDFEYEVEMAQLNRLQDATVESVFIMASPQYSFLSSSGVKELAIFGADISELVPAHVAGPLQEALAR